MAKQTYVVIDLGTQNTLINVNVQGLIFNQKTAIAYDAKTDKIIAVGNEAYNLYGKVGEDIKVVLPLSEGVVQDITATQDFLRYIFENFSDLDTIRRAIFVLAHPSKVSPLELDALQEIPRSLGASTIFIVEEAKLSLIGENHDIYTPQASMVLDIGGGTSDVAVFSAGTKIYSDSVKVAGNRFSEAIRRNIYTNKKIIIGNRISEEIKIDLAAIMTTAQEREAKQPGYEPYEYTSYGRLIATSKPVAFKITMEEMSDALKVEADKVATLIKDTFKRISPEILADIKTKGLVVTGGGSMLRGLKEYLEAELGLKCKLGTHALTAVVEGGIKLEERVRNHLVDNSHII